MQYKEREVNYEIILSAEFFHMHYNLIKIWICYKNEAPAVR